MDAMIGPYWAKRPMKDIGLGLWGPLIGKGYLGLGEGFGGWFPLGTFKVLIFIVLPLLLSSSGDCGLLGGQCLYLWV